MPNRRSAGNPKTDLRVVKNFEAYEEGTGAKTYHHEFTNHGHFICGEPGWESVAEYIADWLETEVGRAPADAPISDVAEAVQ
jgi:hypothetical protein